MLAVLDKRLDSTLFDPHVLFDSFVLIKERSQKSGFFKVALNCILDRRHFVNSRATSFFAALRSWAN